MDVRELRQGEEFRQGFERRVLGIIERWLWHADMVDDQCEAGVPARDPGGVWQPTGNEREERNLMLLAGGEDRIPRPGFQTPYFPSIRGIGDDGAQPELPLGVALPGRAHSGVNVGFIRLDVRHVG